jgi:hypothetical protein
MPDDRTSIALPGNPGMMITSLCRCRRKPRGELRDHITVEGIALLLISNCMQAAVRPFGSSAVRDHD